VNLEIFVLLFSVATLVALATRWIDVPFTAALVLTGLGLGQLDYFASVTLTRELVFSIFLPLLIFEAAYHLDASHFWKDRVAINLMATPGLVLAMFITAGILVPLADKLDLATRFTFVHGVVFAAVIGATDPIAVVALFRRLGAPARLQVLVEGESLVNDGTGIVVFGIAVTTALGGVSTVGGVVFEFVRVAGIGAVVGVAVGALLLQVVRRVPDAMIEISVTVLAAFGSFALAEHLGASGVISTLSAGLVMQRHRASASERHVVHSFWDYVAFALNSVIFLLVGLEVKGAALLSHWKPILAAYAAATIARAAVVFITTSLLARTRRALPWSWAAVVSWSGLRGALSMVLAVSLPPAFPHRDLMVNMAFGIVLLTIVVQGFTMKPLLKVLGVVADRPPDPEKQA
jgi:CPA1 family monovalent cation:H+ antiporter